MKVVDDTQNCPGTPAQVVDSGFNLAYFFSQWATLAQVINKNRVILQNVIAALNGLPGPTPPYVPPTPTQVVTGNAFATVYHNTGTVTKRVYITIQAPGGTAGTATAVTDASPTPTTIIAQASAQTSGGSPVSSMLSFEVLPGNYYEVTRDVSISILYWVECTGGM